MTKTNLKVKNIDDITIEERILLIDIIVNSHFQENEIGEIEYTPYLKEVGIVRAIETVFIEGLNFDENEKKYESIMNDKELKSIIDKILISDIFEDVLEKVDDIVEYKKAENIARVQNDATQAITYRLLNLIENENKRTEKELETMNNFNKWIKEQRKLNSLITPEMQKEFAESLDPTSLINAIIDKYSKSEIHSKNQEIRESHKKIHKQNKEIINLEKELTKKKQRNNVKNVVADKKK